jgi:hypothetical protein
MSITVDVKLIELEQRWREADDSFRAANAELASSERLSNTQVDQLKVRIKQADRLKKSIIEQIEALEEASLFE